MDNFDSISKSLPAIHDAAFSSLSQVKHQVAAKVAAWASYMTSGAIVVDPLGFMNENSRACGVMLGILTYLTNLYFQSRASRR